MNRKKLLFVLAVTTALSAMGFEMRTVIAGLGIGGIAVALAAQKTIENVFGGLSLLGDRVVQIGDVLQIGDRVGTVEDIGLRSTRIRTVERTELSIPNGQLSAVNIENLSRRDKFLFNPALILRTDTTNDQLLYALAEFRKLLYQHPKVERESARVRLAAITEAGFRVEFFTYLLTRDFNESTAAREDILLRVLDILETTGARLASGERILTSDPHENQPGESPASTQVKAWSAAGNLPFPDYRPEDIERMRGTLPYPRPDSALNRDGKA